MALLAGMTAYPRGAADDRDFFETKVRPVLAGSCYDCHTEMRSGGLRLDSREAMLKGGKSGPAVVPGDPDKSLLIQAVRQTGTLKMPKDGKLTAAEIDGLVEWVKNGAVAHLRRDSAALRWVKRPRLGGEPLRVARRRMSSRPSGAPSGRFNRFARHSRRR